MEGVKMENEEITTGRNNGEDYQARRPIPGSGGKRLTPQKTYDRIMNVGPLKIAFILMTTGVILAALYGLLWYSYITNYQSGDEINWFHRHGTVLIFFLTFGVALITGYTASSIAYRPRFMVREDVDGENGEEEGGNEDEEDGGDEEEMEKRELEFPEEGMEGIISRLSQIAVPLFSLLMLLSLIYLFLGYYTGREDYSVFEGYKTVYLSGILHSLIFPLLPVTLLLLFLSGPRGLKRLDRYSPFLLIAGICVIMSVIFSLYFHTELFSYYRDINQGNGMDAEYSEFAINYANEISILFELGAFSIGALIISHMKFKRSARFKFDPTPGMMLFITGFIVFILAVMIQLTIFNPDYDYSGNVDGWGGWLYFLGNAARIILYGAFLLLMVEYSLTRNISEEEVAIEPEDLWEEIKDQNPLISSRMS